MPEAEPWHLPVLQPTLREDRHHVGAERGARSASVAFVTVTGTFAVWPANADGERRGAVGGRREEPVGDGGDRLVEREGRRSR